MGDTGSVIDIENLTRKFGSKVALRNVSITAAQGYVLGLVGENGAGKTTLIRHILGLFRANTGSVRVFGLDPIHDRVKVLGQIGYLSEDRDLPHWMSVGELMRYTQAFYPGWDCAYAEELLKTLELDPDYKIGKLSRGQLAKAGLLIALAHKPKLLLLDEPSSGLDPVVRRDILGAIIRTVADEGRTVLFSSHLLEEVERVADSVSMIHAGEIVLNDSLEDIKANHHRLILRSDQPDFQPQRIPGTLWSEKANNEWRLICHETISAIESATHQIGVQVLEKQTPSLDEIFVAHVKAGHQAVVEA